MVLAVGPEVLGELVDPLGEQGDLHFGGAGVFAGPAVLADQLLLSVLGQRHRRHRVAVVAGGGDGRARRAKRGATRVVWERPASQSGPRPSYSEVIFRASATSRCICAIRSSTFGNRRSPRS